jgi:hypothetical protein
MHRCDEPQFKAAEVMAKIVAKRHLSHFDTLAGLKDTASRNKNSHPTFEKVSRKRESTGRLCCWRQMWLRRKPTSGPGIGLTRDSQWRDNSARKALCAPVSVYFTFYTKTR